MLPFAWGEQSSRPKFPPSWSNDISGFHRKLGPVLLNWNEKMPPPPEFKEKCSDLDNLISEFSDQCFIFSKNFQFIS